MSEPDDDEIGYIRERAFRYADLDRLAEAERIVRRALESYPEDVELLDTLSFTLNRQERYGEAAEVSRSALRLDPDWSTLYYRLAWAQEHTGQPDEAIETLAIGVELDTYSRFPRSAYGLMLCRRERHAEAIYIFRDLLADFPQDAELLKRLGDCLDDEDQYAEANRVLTAALALDPHDSDTHLSLGHNQMNLFRVRDSLESFVRAVRLDPKDTELGVEVRYMMYWPITQIHGTLKWALPVAATGALTSAVTGSPNWLQWFVTAILVVAIGYSAHWTVRGGIAAWRSLFRARTVNIAVAFSGMVFGYTGAAAVLAGTWLPSPAVAGLGLMAGVLVWTASATVRALGSAEDSSASFARRMSSSVPGLVRDYRNLPKQLRARWQLRRRARVCVGATGTSKRRPGG